MAKDEEVFENSMGVSYWSKQLHEKAKLLLEKAKEEEAKNTHRIERTGTTIRLIKLNKKSNE